MSCLPSSHVFNRTGVCLLLAVVLFGAFGCGRNPEDQLTITERKRAAIGPRAAAFMLDAQRAYEMGSYIAALAFTDSVEAIVPDLADLHHIRGNVYTQLNRLETAQAAYETVLEIDPEYAGARYNLGLIAARMGKLRDAIDWLKKESDLKSTSNVLLELGRAYARLGEPDSAMMAYEAAIEMDDSNSTAYMWLGQLYEELGELDQALEVSEKGLALRPDDPDYQYVVGSLLSRMGREQEAEAYLRPVAEALPWHHGAQTNMGQILMRMGETEEAQAYFARADSAQQLYQQITEAEDAINREPRAIEHWIKLGRLLRQSGDLNKAIEAFKVAIALDPWNMRMQNNLALLQMETGQLDMAIRRFRAIVSTDSTMAEVWLNLGAAYANAGLRDQAEAAWKKVVELEPGNPVARSYLARVSEISASP